MNEMYTTGSISDKNAPTTEAFSPPVRWIVAGELLLVFEPLTLPGHF